MQLLMRRFLVGLCILLLGVSSVSHSCSLVPSDSKVSDEVIEMLRKEVGDVYITSRYRACDHPIEAAKGHCLGLHVQGKAIDVSCSGETSCNRLVQAGKVLGFGGIIRYDTHVHLDTRKEVYIKE